VKGLLLHPCGCVIFSLYAEHELCGSDQVVGTLLSFGNQFHCDVRRVLMGCQWQVRMSNACILMVETILVEPLMGLWCSGITSASHAEGPGFKPQWVQFFLVHSICFSI
jgi:hypothetical protein